MRRSLTDVDLLQLVKPLSRQCAVHYRLVIFEACATLAWSWRMCLKHVGAELSILPSLSTPTNWSLPSDNNPDSAHRHRLANVTLRITRTVGLQHFTSLVQAGA